MILDRLPDDQRKNLVTQIRALADAIERGEFMATELAWDNLDVPVYSWSRGFVGMQRNGHRETYKLSGGWNPDTLVSVNITVEKRA